VFSILSHVALRAPNTAKGAPAGSRLPVHFFQPSETASQQTLKILEIQGQTQEEHTL
jgi:hypothetical protein